MDTILGPPLTTVNTLLKTLQAIPDVYNAVSDSIDDMFRRLTFMSDLDGLIERSPEA